MRRNMMLALVAGWLILGLMAGISGCNEDCEECSAELGEALGPTDWHTATVADCPTLCAQIDTCSATTVIGLGPEKEICQAECEDAFTNESEDAPKVLMQLLLDCAKKNSECTNLFICIGSSMSEAWFTDYGEEDDDDDTADDDDDLDGDDDTSDGDADNPEGNLQACYGACEVTNDCYPGSSDVAACKATCDQTGGGVYGDAVAACYEAYLTSYDCTQTVDCLSNAGSR